MTAVIIAPLVETFLFQKMTIAICYVHIKNNLICIILSTILFSLTHLDSIKRVIAVAFTGLCLGLFYTVLKQKKLNAFWLTTLLHASWNLFVFTVKFIDS